METIIKKSKKCIEIVISNAAGRYWKIGSIVQQSLGRSVEQATGLAHFCRLMAPCLWQPHKIHFHYKVASI